MNNTVLKTDYLGKVKEVIEYKKSGSDGYRRYSSTKFYDVNGYLIRSEYYGSETHYTYDKDYNLIKEVRTKANDTTETVDYSYNDKHQLLTYVSKSLDGGEYDYNIVITYNQDGNQVELTNTHSNPEYNFKKVIEYDGNRVTETKMKDSKVTRVETFIYSKENNLLKHTFGYHILFNTYNNKNERTSQMTYRDREYCCSDYYEYDPYGNRLKWIFTNHLKHHKEIHTYDLKYDSHNNMIYEYSSNNVTSSAYEYTYDITYYDQ